MLLYTQRSRLVNNVHIIDWRRMLPEEFNTSRGYRKFTMDNLARFVLRARIVQDHSLAQDIRALEELTKVKFKLILPTGDMAGENGIKFADIKVPHTEQIESAAARVRPVFLFSDGIFYADVLAFLYEKIVDDVDKKTILKLLCECQMADPDYPNSGKGKRAGDGGAGFSNKDLAGSWLYGSLLHDDENRRTFSDATGIEHAYRAAVYSVPAMMLGVVRILHFIEPLVCDGKLNLDPDLWVSDVTFKGTTLSFRGEVSVYVAGVGTPLPQSIETDMLEAEGWKPIQEALFQEK